MYDALEELLPIREGEPSARIDTAAVVGQFLNDLSPLDIVVELVQNDLDAGATRTTITFGEQALVCEGNGKPIDSNGWDRLTFVLGAGGVVGAKKDGIGSKNHGLRSVFLLADDIGVRSDTQGVVLTVTGDSEKPNRFYPAVWPRRADENAPAQGTRITAPYRTKAIRKPDGDNTSLEPVQSELLDTLWSEAIKAAPERFIAASAPCAPWKYTLVLARHGYDTRTFIFESAPLKGDMRDLCLRTCKMREGGQPLRTVARRHALQFQITLTDTEKLPKLFRIGGQLYGELSWPVDAQNKPNSTVGLLRYPIAFSGKEARSGHGFDVSAPFIAARARHTISDDDRNHSLVSQGRDAFAEAAGRRLAAIYGPKLGVLVQSQEPRESDATSERELLSRMLGAGGLCVAKFDKSEPPAIIGSAPMDRGAPLVFAQGRGSSATNIQLCQLAAGRGQVLHPDTPAPLIAVLSKLSEGSDTRLARFDEEIAARNILIRELSAGAQVDGHALCRVQATLLCLDGLRRSGGLPGALVTELTNHGALPTCDRRCVEWKNARRSDSLPPEIPGVRSPPIVHSSLRNASVLNQGPLALRKFDLNDFVSSRDFSNVIAGSRLEFFNWLCGDAASLRTSALKKIADYPIWPGTDGKCRRLSEYCRPRARVLREMLSQTIAAPAPAVMNLVRSHKVIKIRSEPTPDEILGWYSASMNEVKVTQVTDANRSRNLVDRVEGSLEWLRKYLPNTIKKILRHETLTQAGSLSPICLLHIPNENVGACALRPFTLCRDRLPHLYKILGAKPYPTAMALLTALRRDPDLAKLFIRLNAYKICNGNLAELASERIIPVNGNLCAGKDLAFASEPDFWGKWKTRIKVDTPEQQALLRGLGVVGPKPRQEHSVAFFNWLAQQSGAVQSNHHAQIARHWRDHANGPLKWANENPRVRCIPVTGRRRPFGLVSLREASSEHIYLDDFSEIHREILESTDVRLTLVKAPNFQHSILDELKEVKLRSLRGAVGEPKKIFGNEGQTDPELESELRRLQSGKVLAGLKSKLPRQDVALRDLRSDWQQRLKALKGIRISKHLKGEYNFLGQTYTLPVEKGIDTFNGYVCIEAKAYRPLEFYEALARHIYRPEIRKPEVLGFMRAATDRRIPDCSVLKETAPAEEDDLLDPEPTSLDKGHGSSLIRLTPIVPDPKPLAEISDQTHLSGRKSRPRSVAQRSRTDEMRGSMEEEEQKRALKEEHYAFHCQACLGEMDVLKATPPGTYIFAPGYRKRLLQAHHVQHLQNQGMIGGKNLLILCEYHHHAWGDHLSREKVVSALGRAVAVRRGFPKDAMGTEIAHKNGLLASVPIDIEPFVAKLYFTELHAEAWRD